MAPLRQVLLVAIILELILAIFNIRTIIQEGNPLPVLRAIIKLEVTGSNMVPFAENMFMQKTAMKFLLLTFCLSVAGSLTIDWDQRFSTPEATMNFL